MAYSRFSISFGYDMFASIRTKRAKYIIYIKKKHRIFLLYNPGYISLKDLKKERKKVHQRTGMTVDKGSKRAKPCFVLAIGGCKQLPATPLSCIFFPHPPVFTFLFDIGPISYVDIGYIMALPYLKSLKKPELAEFADQTDLPQ